MKKKGDGGSGLKLGYMPKANKLTKAAYTKICKGKILDEYILQLRKILSGEIRLQGVI